MTVLGFNYTKIDVEKKMPVMGKVSINNNISIEDIQPQKISLGKANEEGLKFVFKFTAKYVGEKKEEFGNINLVGEVLFIEKEDVIKKIKDSWKKDKSVDQVYMSQVINSALNKCNIQALILSDTVSLPAPIPMPKLQPKKK